MAKSKSTSPSWYKRKTYPHFDLPMSALEALNYVQSPANIVKHSFMPFLAFAIEQKRFRKEPKHRPIKYASHRDGYIFSYYANILSASYEELLRARGLSEVVLAYRAGRGNNIEFAREAFDFIEANAPCVALGFDISGFFDSIDHQYLKSRWTEVLNQPRLPDDHYAIFRALTKYSYVDRDACYERLGYSRRQRRLSRPICDIRQFRERVKGRNGTESSLISTNRDPFRIPQGSALSALLSNIYMLSFDTEMLALALQLGGLYRRYCDDILFIIPLADETQVAEAVAAAITKCGSEMKINRDKTTSSHFVVTSGTTTLIAGDRPFQYLGFTFDGQRRLMRSQTLSRYWRKIVCNVRKAKKDYARTAVQGTTKKVFKRKLYRRFTHLGRTNFLNYARRSAIIFGPSIRWKDHETWKQVKGHWSRIHAELQR